MQNLDDLCAFGKQIGVNSPYLVVCQTSAESTFHVIVEQEPTCELSAFCCALLHLLGSYFIYDIAYPKHFKATLLMIQHHRLGLPDQQTDPSAVIELVTSLQRMDSTFLITVDIEPRP